MTGTGFTEALFNAMSFASILILTALGLAITFGVMKVINMAHGEMLMLGAYTAFALEDPTALPIMVRNLGHFADLVVHSLGRLLRQDWHLHQEWHLYSGPELSLFWAIPIAFVFVGLIGYLLEVGLIRFLYGRPLDTLLATWGVSLILQQIVLLLFGADLKPMHVPEILSGSWQVAGVAIPIYRVFIVAITGLCILAVYLWFYRTSFGLKIRAVTQNRPMAAALGVSTRRVDSLTFAFGTGLAGVAGCIFGHLYTVKYNMGPDYVVEAFMVVIMGGMGSMFGSVAGGALLGTGDSFIEKILVNASMSKVVVLLAVIGFIMVRPAGLFAPRERSYE
jgi:urea transport system permease protein